MHILIISCLECVYKISDFLVLGKYEKQEILGCGYNFGTEHRYCKGFTEFPEKNRIEKSENPKNGL